MLGHISQLKQNSDVEPKEKEPREAICDGDETIKYCPNLGDFVPDGFELVGTHFVDNSGIGADNESALTFKQFLTKVKKGRFYAIAEVGQFQVFINEYKGIG